jgi:hypothetical protein
MITKTNISSREVFKIVGDQAPYETFASAVAALNSNGDRWVLVVPRGVHVVSDNLTANENIFLDIHQGADISVSSGKTLTIKGMEAGPYQVFSGLGTVEF